MATVQITWDDINDNEDGFHIYRDTAPLDTANPANLPAPLASVAAGVGSYDDTTASAGTTYYYAVAAYKGDFVNPAVDIQVDTAAPDYANAQVGDQIGGGYYAGVITYADSRQFHLIFAGKEGNASARRWGSFDGTVTGATDPDDGKANQDAALSVDNGEYAAFYHCRDYVNEGFDDWYLPATNEAKKAKDIIDVIGWQAFMDNTDHEYWSSTENASYTAFRVKLWDRTTTSTNKDQNYYVRPVRRVPV